jgi:competence protein ComEA
MTIALMILMVGIYAYADDTLEIDINTASAEELTQLKGIGPSHAAGIVAFREKNGPFQKPEDLIQVPRIGPKTFEKNKDLIVVELPEKKAVPQNQKPVKK